MGTFDEVVAHEKKFGLETGHEVDTGTTEQANTHLYEAPDGFRGTYDEVVAYEKEHGFDKGSENMVEEGEPKRETIHIYKVILLDILLLAVFVSLQKCLCRTVSSLFLNLKT